MKKVFLTIIAISVLLCGCEADNKNTDVSERKYTEESDNLAQIEIYGAENNELIKTISDEEMLYQYNQRIGECIDDNSDVSDLTGQQEELKKSMEGLEEQYCFITYKYPAAMLHDRELEKNMTITFYEDSDIIKITVSQESVKGAYVPQEFLEFYYRVSDEDMEFYRSFAEEQA